MIEYSVITVSGVHGTTAGWPKWSHTLSEGTSLQDGLSHFGQQGWVLATATPTDFTPANSPGPTHMNVTLIFKRQASGS
jgi:hypothetical protein